MDKLIQEACISGFGLILMTTSLEEKLPAARTK
jgi:hypothetical protein